MKVRGLKEFSFTVGAGGEAGVEVEGDWCQVHECDASGVVISFDDVPSGRWFQGQGRRVHYTRVRIASITAQTVKLLLGFGHATDGRATANVNVTTAIEPGNVSDDGGDVPLPDGVVTELLPADADRLYALIKNPSTNSATIRVGSAAVTVASGVPVEPGETLPYASVGAIHAVQDSGVEITVSAAAVKLV